MSKRRPSIGLLAWCVAGAAAAEIIHGDALRLQRTPSSVIERGVPHTIEGETYGWQRPVTVTAPGDALDPRPEAAVQRATTALARGQYLEAASEGERALEALESARGVTPLQLARWLVWLGEVQWRTGALGAAESHLWRGLAILERTLGTGHLEVATVRNKLAVVLQAEGLPGRAEPLHQRALDAQLAALGPDHLDVATSLNNLAILYKGQGYYEEAEQLYQRALRIREMALGPDHPDVAASLANLGALYEAEGLHERAELWIRPALDIQRQALGGRHPDTVISMSRLAGVYATLGRYGEAESLARETLDAVQATLGTGHPAAAEPLAQLAAIALARGDAEGAASFAERSLAVRQEALGPSHPEVASSLELLAQVRLAQGRLGDALPLLWRSLGLSEARLRRESLDFSERRLAMFLQLLRRDEERVYALLRAHPDDPRVRHLALTVALLRSGRSVEELANTSRSVYRSLDLPDRDAFDRLRQLRSQLARLSLEGPGSLDAEAYRRQLRELAEQGDALEARVARRSARLRAVSTLPAPEEIADRVADALPADGVLVQFVAYREPAPGWTARQPGPVRYLALVLAPGGRTGAADLGRARRIDEAVARLRQAIASRDAEYLDAAKAACALVFEPLRPLLGGSRRLFISPDGQLALVPFAALHDGRGFLVDGYDFTYVTSGKDLLPRVAQVPQSRSVVVLADPDFEAHQGEARAPAADARTRAERDYSIEEPGAASVFDLAGQQVAPLPGTRLEAEALQGFFPRAEVFLGAEATKERLLRVHAPGILHVATHGFFVEDAEAQEGGSRGLGNVGPIGGHLPAAPPGNPLLRSGLVLAGARSAAADAEGLDPGPEGSLVTALELAGVDLWGTQLVVLSACDTGRGDVKLGQGVYGLRRALQTAGAETVVMSLWKVDDGTTHLLMERYYRNLLDGQGRSAALRAAMQALRTEHPHPYYWAPFISSGSDAPLVLGEPPLFSKWGP